LNIHLLWQTVCCWWCNNLLHYYYYCNGLISRFLSRTCTKFLALKTLVSVAD